MSRIAWLDSLSSPLNSLRCVLIALAELAHDQTPQDLLSHVDQPLKLRRDEKTGQDFIVCDYNRDGDSNRSPWSNEYFPRLADGVMLPAKLRQLEVEANRLFDVYRRMYFEGGHSSVYLFETENAGGFGACFLIHKGS